MPILWVMPDGHVQITRIVGAVLDQARRPGETTDQTVLRMAGEIQAKTPGLAGGIASLVKTADIPTDRSQRHKWRKSPVGQGIIVDLSVPDPPHPKRLLLDEIASATTVVDLKVALLKLVRG